MPDQSWHLQQIIGAYVFQITKLQAELDALKGQVPHWNPEGHPLIPSPAPKGKKS